MYTYVCMYVCMYMYIYLHIYIYIYIDWGAFLYWSQRVFKPHGPVRRGGAAACVIIGGDGGAGSGDTELQSAQQAPAVGNG